MPEKIHLTATIPLEMAQQRLDQALAQCFPQHSRARLQEWVKLNMVTVDGKFKRGKDKILGGEKIEIMGEVTSKVPSEAQPIPLNIIYEDGAILVLNKPAGLVVHPAAGNRDNTLLNALLFAYPALENVPRAGIVHRLDKDTSGILVVAKTLTAHTHLVNQLQKRSMKREYQAVIKGTLISGGRIDEPIGRHAQQRKKMTVTSSGKTAITEYRVLKRFVHHTLIKVSLHTGRTHQIRVHMAHIKHPIVGDPVYGGRFQIPKSASEDLVKTLHSFKRQALHAYRLELTHPETGETMAWTAELPQDMQHLLKVLHDHST
ncbi:MAG: 23S rRNA pseudouridine(1911/1915/1917) synthase RluD [Proteobacteria bacterium]|nr:23S rRNA pseudouridine(1911/1915/1917) synthase RluD [Pseudomonadota bacterium]